MLSVRKCGNVVRRICMASDFARAPLIHTAHERACASCANLGCPTPRDFGYVHSSSSRLQSSPCCLPPSIFFRPSFIAPPFPSLCKPREYLGWSATVSGTRVSCTCQGDWGPAFPRTSAKGRAPAIVERRYARAPSVGAMCPRIFDRGAESSHTLRGDLPAHRPGGISMPARPGSGRRTREPRGQDVPACLRMAATRPRDLTEGDLPANVAERCALAPSNVGRLALA